MFQRKPSMNLSAEQLDGVAAQSPTNAQYVKSPTDKYLNILLIAIKQTNTALDNIASKQEQDSNKPNNETLEKLKAILNRRILYTTNLDPVNLDDSRIKTAKADIMTLLEKIDSLRTLSPVPVDIIHVEKEHTTETRDAARMSPEGTAESTLQKSASVIVSPVSNTPSSQPPKDGIGETMTEVPESLADRTPSAPNVPRLQLPLKNDNPESETNHTNFFELNCNLQLITYLIEGLIILSIIGALLLSGIIFAPEVVAVSTGVATLATADVLFSATKAAYQFFTCPPELSIVSPKNINTPKFE